MMWIEKLLKKLRLMSPAVTGIVVIREVQEIERMIAEITREAEEGIEA